MKDCTWSGTDAHSIVSSRNSDVRSSVVPSGSSRATSSIERLSCCSREPHELLTVHAAQGGPEEAERRRRGPSTEQVHPSAVQRVPVEFSNLTAR